MSVSSAVTVRMEGAKWFLLVMCIKCVFHTPQQHELSQNAVSSI